MVRIRHLAYVALGASGVLLASLAASLRPVPEALSPPLDDSGRARLQVLDSSGRPLSYTFSGDWNYSDQRSLHEIPPFVQEAFIVAEDARFYGHSGVDWKARAHAAVQNVRAGRVVRGASTISEQVVRMLHPRPRSVWARLIEGLEAQQLEARFSKGEILEFYLNQVPFGARRRGVAQAARYYFDRDIGTLTSGEVLALAVMVRSPERLDLYKKPHGVEAGVARLAQRLTQDGSLSDAEAAEIARTPLALEKPSLPVRAHHFVRYVQGRVQNPAATRRVRSTLSSPMQAKIQALLEARVRDLAAHNVTDGAVLAVDNRRGAVLAWVNAGTFGAEAGSQFDAVITPRQPGSTLKPFLYALALSRGWTAATIIDDAPLAEAVGSGLHNFRNYSRVYYGPLPVRDALGNSLNVPAVKTIQYAGKGEFLRFLRNAGFSSLSQPADFYGEGLALGNGEVTLFELVQAYAALANRGVFRPLRISDEEVEGAPQPPSVLVSPDVSSIVSDILADPQARSREFGAGGLLRFPIETAVKTGTSTDYRDAWAVGFSDNYTVGVWLGNLNRTSMNEISGARGAALVLRSVFAELERHRDTRPLFRSPALSHHTVCPISGELAGEGCSRRDELFVPGSEPHTRCAGGHTVGDGAEKSFARADRTDIFVSLPTPGLNIARDPRIPDALEAFPFKVESAGKLREVRWILDGNEVAHAVGDERRYLWPLQRGHHLVRARVITDDTHETVETEEVGFWVR